MKAYSLDLRTKIVQSVRRRGVSISETARRFGVNRSTVGRYLKQLEEDSLISKKTLFAGPQPHRRGLLEDQVLPKRGESPYARGAGEHYR